MSLVTRVGFTSWVISLRPTTPSLLCMSESSTVTTANVSSSAPTLPNIVASKYLVSGQLDYSTVGHDQERKIIVYQADTIVDDDKTGSLTSVSAHVKQTQIDSAFSLST